MFSNALLLLGYEWKACIEQAYAYYLPPKYKWLKEIHSRDNHQLIMYWLAQPNIIYTISSEKTFENKPDLDISLKKILRIESGVYILSWSQTILAS